MQRDAVIDAILRTSSTQGTLGFPIVSSRKRKEKPLVQSTLPFGNKAKPLVQTVLPFRPREPYRTQQDRVYDMVMDKLRTSPCPSSLRPVSPYLHTPAFTRHSDTHREVRAVERRRR